MDALTLWLALIAVPPPRFPPPSECATARSIIHQRITAMRAKQETVSLRYQWAACEAEIRQLERVDCCWAKLEVRDWCGLEEMIGTSRFLLGAMPAP